MSEYNQAPESATFCGTVTLLGRPNAGKSTLLNNLLGQKVAGVSKKPQTTRNRILGILTEFPYQLLFLDTPGLHKTKSLGLLNRIMVKEAMTSLREADLGLYLVDIKQGLVEQDLELLNILKQSFDKPIYVYMSQADTIPMWQGRERCRQAELLLEESGLTVKMLSAKRAEDLVDLKELLKAQLPAGDHLYPDDELTDRPNRFVVSELIRESIFRNTGQELPYETAVIITGYKAGPTTVIDADIIVARSSQKGMIIGQRGQKLKTIGQESRLKIEQLLDQPVFLNLHVRTEDKWIMDPTAIHQLLQLET